MRAFVILGILCFTFTAIAQTVNNRDSAELSAEYGLAYHTLRAAQKSNGTSGRFTSSQNPFAQVSLTFRFTQDWQARLTGGAHFVQFNDPKRGSIVGGTTVLKNYGGELVHKLGPYLRLVVYGRQQDQVVYETTTPYVYEMIPIPFVQTGARIALVQRRRVGLLWAAGVGGFVMMPTKGGDVVTEGGYGAEGYARLGWVGFGGVLYQIKGAYNVAMAPNAAANFTHETLSYSLMISYAF